MKVIKRINKDCFKTEEEYKQFLKLVKEEEEKNKKIKTISIDYIDIAVKRGGFKKC